MLKKILVAAAMAAGLIAAPVANAGTCDDKLSIWVGGYPGVPGDIPTPGGIFPWENGGYDHGQLVGAANTVAAVANLAANCPESEIHVTGHSYGAAIVHTAVEEIDKQAYASRVHVYVTGNPRHSGGIEDTLAGLRLPGLTFRGAGVDPKNMGSFTSVCNPRDVICDFPHPLREPAKTLDHIAGYFTGAHAY